MDQRLMDDNQEIAKLSQNVLFQRYGASTKRCAVFRTPVKLPGNSPEASISGGSQKVKPVTLHKRLVEIGKVDSPLVGTDCLQS